jgi:hypothetical protein
MPCGKKYKNKIKKKMMEQKRKSVAKNKYECKNCG